MSNGDPWCASLEESYCPDPAIDQKCFLDAVVKDDAVCEENPGQVRTWLATLLILQSIFTLCLHVGRPYNS